MEIGAVIAAAPAENVRRERPEEGDVVILLGGRTGRDGCGGATGSSKSHNLKSLETCGAEVQKGNAPEERKLQRLFRNKQASLLIKRCNDFGAGRRVGGDRRTCGRARHRSERSSQKVRRTRRNGACDKRISGENGCRGRERRSGKIPFPRERGKSRSDGSRQE